MMPLYGTTTARTATRALVLVQVAVMVAGIALNVSLEDVLLHKELVEIKEAYDAASDARVMYVMGVAFVLYLISLAGLYFMTAWARWLFTVSWLLALLHPLVDWSMVTIAADVLQLPWAILDVVGGATLAVIWLNAWSSPGRSAEAGPPGVD
jgi:hypothetical protein